MSQIIKKFIGENQVGTSEIRLEATQYLRARNNSDTADVNVFRFNSNGNLGVNLSVEPEVATVYLGTTTNPFEGLRANLIADNNDDTVMDIQSRELLDTSGDASIRFQSRELVDSTGNNSSINWDSRTLNDTGSTAAVDFSSTTQVLVYKNLKVENNQSLILSDSGSENISITAPSSLSASYSLTLPADDGASGQVLQTDGSGVLSWVTPSGGGSTFDKETFVLASGDITNQYIDLAVEAAVDSIQFLVRGAGVLLEGASYDYSVNYTGGNGGVTRITFLNDIATGGAGELVVGDVVQVQYVQA
jgi:hypothetical protein